VQNAALASYAEQKGYRISDQVLGQSIRQLPYFVSDGVFDPERYQTLVANAGMSVARFEQQQRQELVSDQIRSAFSDSAFVTTTDVDRALVLLEQTRTAEYAVMSVNDPTIEVTVTEDELRAYYEENRDEFFAPEQIRVDYWCCRWTVSRRRWTWMKRSCVDTMKTILDGSGSPSSVVSATYY
jgi:peptidyl-prolyl cis-trans isomerase D